MNIRENVVDQGKMLYRLQTIGIPNPYIRPLITEVVKWVRCSGLDWTIDRLKSIKTDLIRLRSGLPTCSWIRKNRRGEFAGSVGSIIRWSLKSDGNFRRGIQVFNLYTQWVKRELSSQQRDKFLTAVQAAPVPLGDLPSQLYNHCLDGLSLYPLFSKRLGVPRPFVTYSGRLSVKAPVLGSKSTGQDDDPLADVKVFLSDHGAMELRQKFSTIFQPLLKGIDVTGFPVSTSAFPPKVGKIAFIQEAGGKLRYVASPYRIYQEALRPLGEFLYEEVRSLPWDCTFDQSKASTSIRSTLNQGKMVHSVDLSNATDYFPLEIQVAVVRALVHPEDRHYVDLWKTLCRGYWESQLGNIQWRKGQPLGMFPSFAAFTLTHGVLLWHLLDEPYNGQFYVLGDDVIILHDALFTKYREVLERMGCPISVNKSLSSTQVAEFAGKIYTSEWVIPQMKWREISDDNFIDICRTLGPRSRRLLRPRQRVIFDMVKNLIEPVGLNFSYPGSNLEDMIKATVKSPWFSPEESVLSALMVLRRRLHKNLYSCTIPSLRFLDREIEEISKTFDEKVLQVMKKTIFHRWETFGDLCSGFSSLPGDLELVPKLPPVTLPPSRLSLLERYEAALK